MNSEITFSQRIKIYASKETVWKKLLSAQFYQLSWGATLSTTWQIGSPVQFKGVWEDTVYTDKGVVQEFKENRFLKFSYWSSFWEAEDVPEEYCSISYSIDEIDKYTAVFTITQEGFRDETHYADTVELWKNTSKLLRLHCEKEELTLLNNDVFNHLISIIASISEDDYNRDVIGKWNAAQIIEHIVIANSGMKDFLTNVPYNSDELYDVNIEPIRVMMLNNETNYPSPDFLIPPVKHYDARAHKKILSNLQVEMNECIQTLDLEEKCGTTEMPPFGYLSIYEWLNFSVFHMLRHKNQLETTAVNGQL